MIASPLNGDCPETVSIFCCPTRLRRGPRGTSEGVSETMAARAAPAKRRAKADTALALRAQPYPDKSRTDFVLAFRAQAHDNPRPFPDVR